MFPARPALNRPSLTSSVDRPHSSTAACRAEKSASSCMTCEHIERIDDQIGDRIALSQDAPGLADALIRSGPYRQIRLHPCQ